MAPLPVPQISQTILDFNSQGTTLLVIEQDSLTAVWSMIRRCFLETGIIAPAGDAEALAHNERIRHGHQRE